jgi:hypothetical protein
MSNCPYCKQEIIKGSKYYLCVNPKCFFYYVPRFLIADQKEVGKPKGRFEQVKEGAKNVFKDIKEEMGKTLNDTKESLNSSGIGYNQESDVFDTEFGRMDAGGL